MMTVTMRKKIFLKMVSKKDICFLLNEHFIIMLCYINISTSYFYFSYFMFHKNLLIILLISLYRSSHQRRSMKKDVLRKFAKFPGKHLCQSLFFNKVPGLNFLRTPFLQNTTGRLFLFIKCC